ncbi:MAG: hypothetical protein JWO15_3406 [Sphingomonadales bacterium]|nr:hypothetical protein [Sphingomonadales bacterium]
MTRDASTRLVRALSVYFGVLSAVDHRTAKWSSATFSGTQHVLWFDAAARADLADLLTNLPEAELPMPGHFVADIEVVERNDQGDSVRIGLRALTIAEA